MEMIEIECIAGNRRKFALPNGIEVKLFEGQKKEIPKAYEHLVDLKFFKIIGKQKKAEKSKEEDEVKIK